MSDFLFGFLSCIKKKKKEKKFQFVDMKIPIDCDPCEIRVRKALLSIEGVEVVDIDRVNEKVTVTGYLDTEEILNTAKSVMKRVEVFPNNMSLYADLMIMKEEDDYQLINLFSDENPQFCTIM